MYNSSAVSNPLLSTPVSPTSRFATSQPTDDPASETQFHQAMNQAQSEQEPAANDKPLRKENGAVKTLDRNTHCSKSDKPAKKANEKDADKNVATSESGDKTAVDTKEGTKKSEEKTASNDKETGDKADSEATSTLTDNPDAQVALQNPLALQHPNSQSSASLSLGNGLQQDGESETDPAVGELALIDGKTKTLDKTATDQTKADGDGAGNGTVLLSGEASGETALSDETTAIDAQNAATTLASGANGKSQVPADPLTSKASTTQGDATQSSNVLATDQAAQATATLTKDALATAQQGDDKAADALTLKTDKTSIETDNTASLANSQDPSSKDSKTIFEKMLQAVAGSSTSAQTQAADSNNLAQSTSSTQSSTSSTSVNPAIAQGFAALDPQSPSGRNFVVQTAVPVNVGQPHWGQAVGEKVLWLAAQNVSSAEIRLDPPDLGTMQVKISVNQDQATVSFTSHHAAVREVLDQNMNRLRDMFTGQGINLVSVDVSDKSFARQQGDGKGQQGQGGGSNEQTAAEEETPVAVSTIVQKRLVDHYA